MNAGQIALSGLIMLGTVTAYSQEKKVIVFVCEHGAARSAIASAYFNRLASEKGLPYTSIFRGIQPDSTLTPGTRKGLAADGFQNLDEKPASVVTTDVEISSRVVTFDCTLPFQSDKPAEKWDGVPPISQSYETAREMIRLKVEKLVADLERKK